MLRRAIWSARLALLLMRWAWWEWEGATFYGPDACTWCGDEDRDCCKERITFQREYDFNQKRRPST